MMARCFGCTSTRLGEQRFRVEAEFPQHRQRHEGRARQQKDGLDDLHPGGREHAAEGDIDDHQDADDDHRHPVVEAEQDLDQLAGADHLGDQVEGHGDQRAAGGEDADGRLAEAERGDVGEGVLAEVAQRLCDQEGDDGPADEKADRVDQPVEARKVNEPRDAEERGGRHIVAGDRDAVLESGDAAAGRIELGGGFRPLGRPIGNAEGQADEQHEHHDGVPVGRLLRSALNRAGRSGEHGNCDEKDGRERGVEAAHQWDSSTISRVRLS
jgi:hypothetical protein